jgi:hypothetical protein
VTGRIFQALPTQTYTTVALIYKICGMHEEDIYIYILVNVKNNNIGGQKCGV